MAYIRKEEALEVLDKLIKARNCDCSRQKMIERQAFEYCKTIINKLEEHEEDKDIR